MSELNCFGCFVCGGSAAANPNNDWLQAPTSVRPQRVPKVTGLFVCFRCHCGRRGAAPRARCSEHGARCSWHTGCVRPQHLRSTILKSMLDTPSLRTGRLWTGLSAHPTRSGGTADAAAQAWCMRPVARCALRVARCTLYVCATVATDAPQVVGALLEQLADPRLQRRRDRNHDLPHSVPCARMLLRIGTMSYVAKRR